MSAHDYLSSLVCCCVRLTVYVSKHACVVLCADVSMCQRVAVGAYVVSASVRVNNRQHMSQLIGERQCIRHFPHLCLPHCQAFGNPSFDLDPALQDGIDRPN